MRVMIELSADGDIATADDLLSQVLAAGSTAPVLLHGLDESCWPLLEHAGVRGVQTRIGMEDTLRLPDGSTAVGQRGSGVRGGPAAQSVGAANAKSA